MRLTRSDIGKKVIWPGMSNQILYYILLDILDKSEHNLKMVVCFKDGHFKDDFLSQGQPDWEYYYGEKDNNWFDFTRFGCNKKHVEDLITELDKRYILKGETK